MAMSQNLRGAFLALGSYCAYACCDVALKVMGQDVPAFQVVLVTGLFSLPVLLAFTLWTHGANFSPLMPFWSLVRVVVTSANVVAVIYTFTHLPLAQCYAIFFSIPLIVTLLAWPLLGERVDALRGGIIALGFVGVLIAVQPGSNTLQMGHLTALVGAVLGAANSLILRKIGGRERQGVLLIYPALGQIAVATALLATYEWHRMTPQVYGAASFIGVAATIGSVLFIAAYRIAPIIVVAPMQYSQIIWASILGYLIFAELPEPVTLFGICLIITAGVALLFAAGLRPETKLAA